ncbi:MAG TPA: FAD-binding oxidoreductase [Thermohalobaculum sp.]|nr:FAD-binding oxidoreductase [Thermohalobaculum sp.]
MSVWADGMIAAPFWHAAAPPEPPSNAAAPERAEVLIVGAGYTGLSAALALAEAGREAVVLDAGPPGAGASTRNGGMIGWGHRASIASLARRYGEAQAARMLREARLSLDFTVSLIDRLPGDAMYRRTGRFLGAGSPRHFARLARWAETEAPRLGMQARVVARAEQGAHIAGDLYHGGLHFPEHGGLHPALFHRALLEAARRAGARVVDHCKVTAVSGGPGDWTVRHVRGETRAGALVYALNGYTGGGRGPFRALARRLMPIPSTIIATEPLGANRLASLIPGGAMIVETRSYHSYFRPCPWGERILYGGRASLVEMDERASARRLRDYMLSVFPGLEDVRLTHSWKGYVAFTFDGVPHIGQVEGIWHACGYNGSGVAMAPYLGWRLAQRILGTDLGATAFDPAPFRAQPLYGGNPWFLRLVEAFYRVKDRIEGVRALRRH